ncbi:MAG: hypothetical protein HFH46_03255 [Bacilli bacterium]|nr:hypothetical protein [Bacilli bacterium]
MNKKVIKKQNHITMELFLRNYCGVQNEALVSQLSELSHRDLKEVCRQIYGIDLLSVSFESLSKEDLNCGNILLVYDAYHASAPYINPLKKKEQEIVNKPVSRVIQDDTLDSDEIIDIIEENMTIPDVDISSIGSFTLTKKRGR